MTSQDYAIKRVLIPEEDFVNKGINCFKDNSILTKKYTKNRAQN